MKEEELHRLISAIESSSGFASGDSLKRIAEILRSCSGTDDLCRKRKLIERMVVDGVSDYQLGEKILNFLKS